MGVIFGLLAALGWGGGDFALSRISRRIGPLATLLYIQAAGVLSIGLVLLVRRDLPPLDPELWALGVVVNLLNVAGTLFLYRALAVGTVMIVSPIAASFAVVTATLAMLGGERLAPLTLAGVALVMAGVVVVSRGGGREPLALNGVPAALGAALAYGAFFYLLGPVTAGMGIAWPVLIGRVMACSLAAGALLWRRQRPAPLSPRLLAMIVIASSLDTLGFLAYNTGIATAYVSVVTALASIFSAVTVLLAWVLLRERLVRTQWAGVVAVLVGVLLVSLR
ncbi:MAG: DMT family transporter [Chloroflexaceae bacterium]